jgi:hypothetical protein
VLVPLSENIRAVLGTLSDYLDGGSLGGVYTVITRDFGLSDDVADTILISSASNEAALIRAYAEIPPQDQIAKLQGVVTKLMNRYPAAKTDSSFREALFALPGDTVPCYCGPPPVFIDFRPASACHGPC